MSEITALIVDDESISRDTLMRFIDWKGLGINNVYDAEDGAIALKLAARIKPNIIISDIKMPRLDGLQLAEGVRKLLPDCHFVFLSGYANKENLKEAIKLKAAMFVEKPIDLEEITAAIKEFVKEYLATASQGAIATPFFSTKCTENIAVFKLHKAVLREMEQCLKTGNRAATVVGIKKLVHEIDICPDTDTEYIRNIFRQLIFLYVKSAEFHDFTELSAHANDLLLMVQQAKRLHEISDSIHAELELFFTCVETHEISPLTKLQMYLDTHYNEDSITILSISQAMNFTPNYLCVLFKKHTGITIIQYITKLRLAKAQQLLTEPKIKLYSIAREVGYTDGKYFTRVFTKNLGMSPRQYRERHQNET